MSNWNKATPRQPLPPLTDDCVSPGPTKGPTTHALCADLSENLNYLSSVIAELEKLLEPVLSKNVEPANEAPAPLEKDPILSPLNAEIQLSTRRVVALRIGVQQIIHRIQL